MLTYIAYKFEAFNTEAMANALQEKGWRGVFVTWNYAGQIKTLHCPPEIPLKKNYYFFRPGTWTENRLIKWPRLLIILTWILFVTLSRTKTKRFFVAGGDIILWIAQVFKFFGRIEKTVITIEDWHVQSPHGGFFDRMNNIKMRLNDWILMRLDTHVIVYNREMFDLRNDYWKGKTLSSSVLLDHQWAWFLERKNATPKGPPGKFICTLGNLRYRFGTEMLFSLLPGLNRDHGFRLRVIGPETNVYRHYKKMADELGLQEMIDWRGFVEIEDLPKALAGCFCGVNVQEDEINNGRFVISGRMVNYLQCVLPPVVSEYSGSMIKYLKEYKLGVVCDANPESYRAAILQAHAEHEQYVANIDRFLESNPYVRDVADLLVL